MTLFSARTFWPEFPRHFYPWFRTSVASAVVVRPFLRPGSPALSVSTQMPNKVKWQFHDMIVYDPPTVTWSRVAGVYIFCGLNRNNQWVALYIGQTNCFADRMPTHERWQEAVRLGATHIHAMTVPLAANRDRFEEELIRVYQPPLNTQKR